MPPTPLHSADTQQGSPDGTELERVREYATAVRQDGQLGEPSSIIGTHKNLGVRRVVAVVVVAPVVVAA